MGAYKYKGTQIDENRKINYEFISICEKENSIKIPPAVKVTNMLSEEPGTF